MDDIDWYWTYDCMDWSVFSDEPIFGIDSLEAILARMDEDVPDGGRGLQYPGSSEIVLTHDHETSTHIFEPIIRRLLEKGLHFQLPFSEKFSEKN